MGKHIWRDPDGTQHVLDWTVVPTPTVTFDAEMQRLTDLDTAVRNYLSHLYALEQGADDDEAGADYWREQLEVLTSGEPPAGAKAGAYVDDDGNVWEVE